MSAPYRFLRTCGMTVEPSILEGGSGVYFILNRGNNKIYVGQTAGFLYRLNDHCYTLLRLKHSNHRLQHDWDVFGPRAFTCGVLAKTPDGRRFDKPYGEQRLDLEKIFINVYQAFNPNFGYNLFPRKDGRKAA